jgi:hypothetical protein
MSAYVYICSDDSDGQGQQWMRHHHHHNYDYAHLFITMIISIIITSIIIIMIIITVGEVSTQAGSKDLYEAGWIGYIYNYRHLQSISSSSSKPSIIIAIISYIVST